MKRQASLLVCLSLSIFTMARAIKPSHTLAVIGKSAEKNATKQKANATTSLYDTNKALAQSEEQEGAADEDTGEKVASDDDDSIEDASDNEDEDVSDADASGDDDASDDDSGGDDDGGD
jgi:hypothetical protein